MIEVRAGKAEPFRSSGGEAAKKLDGVFKVRISDAVILMRAALLILIAMFAAACNTNPVVGEWKAVRRYDSVRKQLAPVTYEGLLEVSSDGTFKVILPDRSQRAGQYKLDEAANPPKFTATEKDGRMVRGIYRVAGDKLSIRVADDSPDSDFPTKFDPNDDTNPGLVELERKK